MVAAPFDIVLSEFDVLQPDVVFFSEARAAGLKMSLLERYGLPEYWIVDPVSPALEVYGQEAGRFALVATFESGDTVRSATLPGLSFDLDRLFSD